MKLHRAIKKANDEKDIETLMPLYQNGSRESLISVKMLENGQVLRQETGATLMN